MTGIALPLEDVPAAVLDRHRLHARVHKRGQAEEVQFHYWHRPALLPVRLHGRVEVLPWKGWVPVAHVEGGAMSGSRPEPVVIPAALGHHAGVWFLIVEGVRGVVVWTRGGPAVYMLTAPSTNYYRNMTEQSETMPVLVGQVI